MSKVNKLRFTFLDIKSVTPSTGKQIRRPLNYCAEFQTNQTSVSSTGYINL